MTYSAQDDPSFCSILVAPNEDGFGPSTFAFYIVRQIIEQWEAIARGGGWPEYLSGKPQASQARLTRLWPDGGPAKLRVVFRNWGKGKYLRSLFPNQTGENHTVEIENIDNIIRLGKRRGELGFENTLDNLLSYPRLAKVYCKLPFPSRCIGAIDIGVPQVAAAAKNFGVPCVTLFDHAWGRSMQEIFKSFAETERYAKGNIQPSDFVSKAIQLVCEHEAMTDIVFLFPTYIAPKQYYEHWRNLGVSIVELGGVLGGKSYVIDAILKEMLGEDYESVLAHTDEGFLDALKESLSDQRYIDEVIRTFAPPLEGLDARTSPAAIKELLAASEDAHRGSIAAGAIDGKAVAAFRRAVAKKRLLQFEDDLPVVYVSGGATAVWDELWDKIIKGAIEQEKEQQLRFALVISHFPDAAKFGIEGLDKPKRGDKPLEMRIPIVNGRRSERIRFVRDIEGGTHQEIYYGTDLIVTRAGGGTANDAIATRTPLVCVQEPGHWQVEAIRKALALEGFARWVTLESFRNNPLGVMEHELFDRWEDNEKLRRRLDSVKPMAEINAARLILNYFLDREGYYGAIARELLFV